MVNNIKKYLHSRAWLNIKEQHDTGAIQCSVVLENDYVDAAVSVWDCSKKVVLNFSFANIKNGALRARKIDILINELIKTKEALGEAYDDLAQQGNTLEGDDG